MKETSLDSNTFTDLFSSEFLLGNVGAPFIIGLALGYFAKKMLLVTVFVGGAIIALLFLAEYYDIITINDLALQNAANSATQAAKASGSFFLDRLSTITSRGISAAGGFFVGFKLG